MSSQPSKQELAALLHAAQKRIAELETRLAVSEAVAQAKASARVTSAWLASDEYKDLKSMLESVLERLK